MSCRPGPQATHEVRFVNALRECLGLAPILGTMPEPEAPTRTYALTYGHRDGNRQTPRFDVET